MECYKPRIQPWWLASEKDKVADLWPQKEEQEASPNLPAISVTQSDYQVSEARECRSRRLGLHNSRI